MPPLKNLRQETFCLEYVKDHNGTRSFKAAGYQAKTENAIWVGAVQVLRSTKVKARIMELEAPAKRARQRTEAAIAEKAIIDRAWVVGRLVENVDRSMQAVAVLDKLGNKTGMYVYEGQVANRGLELIGKDIGMFVEKSPLDGLFAGANIQVNLYMPSKGQHAHGNGSAIDGNGQA